MELFFKWIKQHLRIKQFYGTSENAVKTQIWIAVSVYVRRHKKRLDLRLAHTLLQILSVTPIHQALAGDENRCNRFGIYSIFNRTHDLSIRPMSDGVPITLPTVAA